MSPALYFRIPLLCNISRSTKDLHHPFENEEEAHLEGENGVGENGVGENEHHEGGKMVNAHNRLQELLNFFNHIHVDKINYKHGKCNILGTTLTPDHLCNVIAPFQHNSTNTAAAVLAFSILYLTSEDSIDRESAASIEVSQGLLADPQIKECVSYINGLRETKSQNDPRNALERTSVIYKNTIIDTDNAGNIPNNGEELRSVHSDHSKSTISIQLLADLVSEEDKNILNFSRE
ncbi:hypothetical protein ANN_19528 [Periplaneta americana]|uniref:Uncharacterized protein n=1 Tax=Periplaneta americana TaxID=6978 RepID=A0ABQ8SB13_PERAM|nr:hypothetical protein ANN_19528 [Periplaneta americana]